MANVLISGRENEAVETAAEEVAEWTRGYLARAGLAEEVTLIGPATSPIGRIRGRWRRHFLLRSGRARALGEVLWALFEGRSEEHTSELQSRGHLVCRLLLEKKNDTAT